MRPWQPSRRFLAAGLALSVAVHFGIGFVARVTPVAGGRPVSAASEPVEMAFFMLPEKPARPPEPERVELGLERSDADTEAWLGFEEATEHEAPESEVEQSALTPRVAGGQAGVGAPEPIVVTASQARESVQSAAEADAERVPEPVEAVEASTSALVVETLAMLGEIASEALVGADAEVEAEVAETVADEEGPARSRSGLVVSPEAVEHERSSPEDAEPPVSDPAPRPEAGSTTEPHTDEQPPVEPQADEPERSEPADAIIIPPGANSTPGEGGEDPGEKSPSEASAISLQTPIDVRPGRVAAAQGLQITTVRPTFDLATMVLTRPRSPTLVIEFGKDGAVRRARFLPGRSTGDAAVDQPLLDAIYRWTARGEALARLADEEHDTVAITMRIILR